MRYVLRIFRCRGCPAGRFLFLLRQEKEPKEGDPPAPALRASLGFPGKSGGRVKLGLLPQTNAADSPRFTRKTEAVQRGIKNGLVGEARVFGVLPGGEGGFELFFGPLAPPLSSTAGPGDFGEDCLSAQREFRSRPARRAAQGTRSVAEGGGVGSPFLRLHSFGEAKEGTSRRAAPGNQTTREAHKRVRIRADRYPAPSARSRPSRTGSCSRR